MYIGQLAQLTGCTPKAIRLYESLGLLPAPVLEGKYRVYTSHHIAVVRVIRLAQAVGFKLSDLRTLFSARLVLLARIDARRQQVKAQQEALAQQDQRLVELQQAITALSGPAPRAADEHCGSKGASGQVEGPSSPPASVAKCGR